MTDPRTAGLNDDPLLSVVIPAHDVEIYLAEMLRSVLRQDLPEMEVIVVDDHSSDDTVAIAESFASSDDRVRVLRSHEKGGALARNLGAAHAEGRYLVFLDGDDIVPDGALPELVRTLEESGSDMAAGRYLKFSSTKTWDPTRNWPVYKERVHGTSLHSHPALLRGRPCWNKVFRREFWEREALEFPNVPRSNDILPITRALIRATTIDIIPDVVYLYRERPGSGSMTARASSSDSVLSYLEQERACMAEVTALGDERIENLYFALLLEADVWVHIGRWVQTASEDDLAEDLRRRVVEHVTAFLASAPARVVAKLKPERRAYFELVISDRIAPLRGLDLRGEIGNGPALADPAAFRAVEETIRGVIEADPVFIPVVARGFVRRIAEPMWAAAASVTDDDLRTLAEAAAAAGAALTGDVLPLIGANARRLLLMAESGGLDGIRRQAEALLQPEPVANVVRVTSSSARFGIEVEPSAREIRLVCVHRESGREVTGEWTVVSHPASTAVSIRVGECTALGVWELGLDIRSEGDEVRRAVAAADRYPALPSDPLASITMSRVKHPGHHIVFVRSPGAGRRALGAVARRARRFLGGGR